MGGAKIVVEQTVQEMLTALVPDAWALLNVKPNELRTVASGEYDPEEVDDLFEVLTDLRAMFGVIATGELFTSGSQNGTTSASVFAWAGERVKEAFREHGFRDRTAWHVDATTGRASARGWMFGDGPNVTPLFKALGNRLWLLWTQLQDVQRDRLYTCQQCGKIGPAERAGRMFYGGTCKKRWQRAKERSVRLSREGGG